MLALDNARTHFDDAPIDGEDLKDGEVLKAYIAEATGGRAEHVEDFCIRNRIPFVRSSGSVSGIYGCESKVFTGDGEPRHYELSESAQVVLDRETFRGLGTVEAVEAWFEEASYTPPPLFRLPRPEAATGKEADHG
ncbi:hypothetical protein [Sphingomonas abietis]|uniref:Uncharacterized protein n=1 Tax=Sphingomonas abietis TaxID=3012344 RepID=A0ABY7NJM8_9SPHN|nr:hypothetical protein [Sphingomonas abietis]WBO21745.1 hypothetical protein PBT88_16460 [Sphingomonas abietis]